MHTSIYVVMDTYTRTPCLGFAMFSEVRSSISGAHMGLPRFYPCTLAYLMPMFISCSVV